MGKFSGSLGQCSVWVFFFSPKYLTLKQFIVETSFGDLGRLISTMFSSKYTHKICSNGFHKARFSKNNIPWLNQRQNAKTKFSGSNFCLKGQQENSVVKYSAL